MNLMKKENGVFLFLSFLLLTISIPVSIAQDETINIQVDLQKGSHMNNRFYGDIQIEVDAPSRVDTIKIYFNDTLVKTMSGHKVSWTLNTSDYPSGQVIISVTGLDEDAPNLSGQKTVEFISEEEGQRLRSLGIGLGVGLGLGIPLLIGVIFLIRKRKIDEESQETYSKKLSEIDDAINPKRED